MLLEHFFKVLSSVHMQVTMLGEQLSKIAGPGPTMIKTLRGAFHVITPTQPSQASCWECSLGSEILIVWPESRTCNLQLAAA